MGFFDLNIPYYESDRNINDKSDRKTARLKLIVKAMELGYTGIAYSRTMKGVMSESDRCSVSLFPLSSLLKLAPSLSSSVKLHRDLLGVPMSVPFRQYTRLTVVVDSAAQATALNSGNPILKSYDIVAVRPMNQTTFELACQASEVDLIAIDFSLKLPFRLKQPMVKAAIQRGVYFEISYSSLIIDIQVRRQTIANAKLLVDWTRGKNLIFSSAAPSVTELRGPYDVANLSSLLGLSMERAKAATSKNCRSLIANALRKKHCYKEAIRIEAVPSSGQFDAKKPAFDDWLKWDPISSGDGDLLLVEMAKSFTASTKVSNGVKATDFAYALDTLTPQGWQVKDSISNSKMASKPSDAGNGLSSAEDIEIHAAVHGGSKQLVELNLIREENKISLTDDPVKHLPSCSKDACISLPTTNTLESFSTDEEIGSLTVRVVEEPNLHVDSFEETGNQTATMEEESKLGVGESIKTNLQLNSCMTICEEHVSLQDDTSVHALPNEAGIASGCNAIATATISSPSMDVDFSLLHGKVSKTLNIPDLVLDAQDVVMDEVLAGTDAKIKENIYFDSCEISSSEPFLETHHLREMRDVSVTLPDGLHVAECYANIKHKDGSSVTNHEMLNSLATEITRQVENQDLAMENIQQIQNQDCAMKLTKQIEDHSTTSKNFLSERRRGKRTSHRGLLFPFKRLLSSVSFKKKTRRFRIML